MEAAQQVTTSTSGNPPSAKLQPSPLLVPVLLLCAGLVALNGTSGIFVIPSVARDFDVALDAAQWVATVTLMTGAVSSPIISRLASNSHRRQFMLGILLLVALASVACALAPSFSILIGARAVQGLCMALIPLSVAAGRAALPDDQATKTASLLSTTTTIGMGVVYLLASIVIEAGSYHDVFWLQAAYALLVLILLVRIPHPREARTPVHIDLLGSLLMTIWLVTMLVAITIGPHRGFSSWQVVALLAVACGSLAAWFTVGWRSPAPVVNIRLLVSRAPLAAVLCTFLLGAALYVAISLNSRFLQQPVNGHERSLVTIGVTLFPMSLGAFVGMHLRPRLMRRWPLSWVVAAGSVVMGGALVWLGLHREYLWEFGVAVFLTGLAGSLTFSVMPQILLRDVPPAETAAASSMNQVMRLIGASIGSAASVAILAALTDPAHRDVLADDDAYTVAYLAGAAITVVGALLALLMLRGVRVFPASPGVDATEPVS